MIKKVVFEDKIVLYWDRQAEYVKGYFYCIKYGLETVYTDKTHFTITQKNYLESSFGVSVSLVDADCKLIKLIAEETLAFSNKKRRCPNKGTPP